MCFSSSSNSDEDILEDLDQLDLVLFQMMATMASITNDLFNSHKMEKRGGQFVGPTVGIQDVLGTM
jgi:hypothetical protein